MSILGGDILTTKNVLIIGANGQISIEAIHLLLEQTENNLVLYLRNKDKLKDITENERITIIEGDATDNKKLKTVLNNNIDVVFASLAGNIDEQAETIVSEMENTNVQRLIFVTALGLYDEVPGSFGEWNNENIGAYLPPYKQAADIIEDSNLNYTILRPAWLTNYDEIDYETTGRNELFKGTEVSRKSVAAIGVEIIENEILYSNQNIGVNKPNTDGNKPQWL